LSVTAASEETAEATEEVNVTIEEVVKHMDVFTQEVQEMASKVHDLSEQTKRFTLS
jgi:methyl-accepting chemotaxis protein